jgi:hypothetical protein
MFILTILLSGNLRKRRCVSGSAKQSPPTTSGIAMAPEDGLNDSGDTGSRLIIFLSINIKEDDTDEGDGLSVMLSTDWRGQQPCRQRIKLS